MAELFVFLKKENMSVSEKTVESDCNLRSEPSGAVAISPAIPVF